MSISSTEDPGPGRGSEIRPPSPASSSFRRNLLSVLLELIDSEPVLVINGARTVGKSTLLRRLALHHQSEVVDLDDLATRQAVTADPTFFAAAPSPVLVDEFQHVPALLDAIKAELNRDLRPGRFVLTGSTRYLTMPTLSQSLAGRVHVTTLWPLAQAELERPDSYSLDDGLPSRHQQPATFVDQLMDDPESLVAIRSPALSRDDVTRRVLAGGFPLVLGRPEGPARSRWFRDYVRTVIERDVLEIRRIRQRGLLPLILRQLAARTGGILRASGIARAVEQDQNLVGDFIQLLETVFLVHRLPAFGRTLNSRVTASPKVHLVDSGLGAYLLGLTERRLVARDPAALTEFGHLLETFVVNEVIKQVGWSQTYVEPAHFRTSSGQEVDLVIEADDGRVAAVEVKAGSRVPGEDLRGLRLLRDKLGSRFAGGVVLYLGERSYHADDQISVLPVDRLWT
ncbi:ATP-binding protein [Frankia sp. CiP3]|uniref:ATP-binding protein n=1 Tax=Frankia sp. CiP3 TaxID=2880971 RepID=UPI001EF513B7|nr:ATP-binding protein [Frankia sp. CiP3]